MSTEKQDLEVAVPWHPLVVDHGFYSPLMSGSIDGTDSTPHDKAIRRALEASYRVDKKVQSDPEKTIFIARLSHRTTQEVLCRAFTKYGEIKNCHLVRDIVTGRSSGYAFIEFETVEEAETAYEECHDMFLDGSQLVVDYEAERLLPGWVPRRLGGGLGGKKESGQLRFGGRDRPFRKPILLSRPAHGTYSDRATDRVDGQSRRPPSHRHRGEGSHHKGDGPGRYREESRRRHSRTGRSRSRSRPRY
ncbi:U11/U12 small nuclear ribonucleoprotein 35 kDa protein-like [Halichondria panicea]|uniref:U11/U12 small nuclear ribonucleoprotein 35 kDa protein-like n=1 Tax=Halichondria panicea TaxID=6063 RepID=UPI00312B6AE0